MAEFVTELVIATEERLLKSVSEQGVDVSLVSIARELRVADNKRMLMEEVHEQ